MADPIYSQVYVFNLYKQQATIQDVNGFGQPANPTIAAPQKGSAAPYWAPQQTSIGRTNLSLSQITGPELVNAPDSNSLSINYGQGGQRWIAPFVIPDPPSPDLESDLFLYVAFKNMFLINSENGALLAGPIQLRQVSAEGEVLDEG
jgi:hypothetical protein